MLSFNQHNFYHRAFVRTLKNIHLSRQLRHQIIRIWQYKTYYYPDELPIMLLPYKLGEKLIFTYIRYITYEYFKDICSLFKIEMDIVNKHEFIYFLCRHQILSFIQRKGITCDVTEKYIKKMLHTTLLK